MTPRRLQILKAVVFWGDQRQAAHELGISYSTLKRQIELVRIELEVEKGTGVPKLLAMLHNRGELSIDELTIRRTDGRIW